MRNLHAVDLRGSEVPLLRAFVAVAETGTVTHGARRLHISQPALSRRIQLLERDLGAELLSRGRTGVVLTGVGAMVLTQARRIVNGYDHLRESVATYTEMDAGTLRIGGGATAVAFLLPEAIAAFLEANPGVRFEVKEAGSREIARLVEEGDLEIGIVTMPVSARGVEVEPFLDDEIVLVGPRTPPEDEPRVCAVPDLDGKSLIGFEAESPIRRLIDAELLARGVEMSVVMELRSISTMLRMVEAARSHAFVSRLCLEPHAPVEHIPVAGLSIRRRLGLVFRTSTPLSPLGLRFAETLRG